MVRFLLPTLIRLGACPEACNWGTFRTVSHRAWAKCPRPDWMGWLIERLDVEPRLRILAVCRLTRRVLAAAGCDDAAALAAIEAAEAWVRTQGAAEAAAALRAADAVWLARDARATATAEFCAMTMAAMAVRDHADMRIWGNIDDARRAGLSSREIADTIREAIPFEVVLAALDKFEGEGGVKRRLKELLEKLGACDEAMEWAGRRFCTRTAYKACPDFVWLNWLALALGINKKLRARAWRAFYAAAVHTSCSCRECFPRGAAVFREHVPFAAFEAALAKWEAKRHAGK